MEFNVDLQGTLRTKPRGELFTTVGPKGTPGLSWKSKFGYLFIDSVNQNKVVDGMNEKGLSFGALYLPGDAVYQNIPKGKENKALPYLLLGDWILGNFQTIDEVKKALPTVYVFEQKLPVAGDMIFPLHFSVYDTTGKGIVVEYTKNGLQIYDNALGILTNAPTYDWHITNLRNYVHLSPYSPDPITAAGMIFAGTGQGSGSVGLPGDISPPSRFIKILFLKQYSIPSADDKSLITLADHIINNVDIPMGVVRAKQQNGRDAMEFTQWTVMKDLTHKIFYYRSYYDPTLRSISIDKINFSEKTPHLKMPFNKKFTILDETDHFLKNKN